MVQKQEGACWQLEDRSVCALIMGKAGRNGAARCAHSCRMLAEVARSEPIVYDAVLCEFEAPFDKNGVLYYIGTRGGTREWANPHLSGEVVAAMSWPGAAHCAPDRFVVNRMEDCEGDHPGHNFTQAYANSWMSMDLGEGRSLRPRHYCLRHSAQPEYVLRTWMLQGSEDGQEWHTLRLHEGDDSLAATASSVAGWAVEASGAIGTSGCFSMGRTLVIAIISCVVGSRALYGELFIILVTDHEWFELCS